MRWCCRLLLIVAILSPCAAAWGTIIEHGPGEVLEAGSVVTVPLVVTNHGFVPWSSANGFSISYHWLNPEGEIVVWDGRRSALPATVAPGANIELMAAVEAPRKPGRYLLQWDVVQEDVRWISESDANLPEPVPVSVVAGHVFSVVEGSAPRWMAAGATVAVELVLRNDGGRTWLADGSFAAAYHWLDSDGEGDRPNQQDAHWEGRRTRFPTAVGSGETVELSMVVVAPRRPGVWRLQWDLVEEGVCWFSERAFEPPPAFRVLVVPDPFGSGLLWSLLMLTAGAAAVSVWRSGDPGIMATLFAVGDVWWCVGAVSVKQGVVLAGSGAHPTLTGWLLIVGGASALALVTRALPERLRGWACWIVVAGATLLLWADSIYLRFFGDLPSPAAIAGIGQVGRVEASIRALIAPGGIWLWLDLLPGLVLVLIADRLRRSMDPRRLRFVTVGLVLAIAAAGAVAVRLALAPSPILGQVFRRVAVAEQVGVLNLHAMDGVRSIARSVFGHELDTAQFDEIVAWFRDRAPERAAAGPSFAAAEGANLVMVQVESLQAFVIGLEIGGREVTPFLNHWTEDALWFSNVTDQTGQGRSSDSELETQVSLLPMAGGAAAFRCAGNDFTGLAEALAERGYDTLSAVPYDGAFWNRRRTHPAYGYARSLFVEDFGAGESIGWGLSDRDFLTQAARRLETADRPFAAYLLTLSLHHPFAGFPTHLEELDVGDWEGTAFGNYIHTMHYFDASLAAFVAALEREGFAESTVIAVWGDHDAGFSWRPRIASAMGVSHDAAGWYLSQEVPLFIRVPGVERLRGERTVAAGHTDVPPTLLALLGVDPAPYAFVGRNLLGDHGDSPVVGEYGCWRDSTHLFLQGDGSLDDGACIELASMAPAAANECREGFDAARRTETISALVLEHDLQGAIHRALVGKTVPSR